MGARIGNRWMELRDSLWFVPAILTLAAVFLAIIMVHLDRTLTEAGHIQGLPWIFSGGVEGSRGVLGAIAASLISVTGTIFSITIVALQLASGQFTPRVMHAFTGDRRVQVVLGTMIATFTYTLLVLRSVRSELRDADAFVPTISTSIAIVLSLVSVGMLIYFIHHVARTIQVAFVVDRAAHDTRNLIKAHRSTEPQAPVVDDGSTRIGMPHIIHATSPGYIRAIDDQGLLRLVSSEQLTIDVQPKVGDYIVTGAELARVWGWTTSPAHDDETIRRAFIMGMERTLLADISLGIRQVVDICLRALSPGINDPTTAMICIDQLMEVLRDVAHTTAPANVRAGKEGGLLITHEKQSFAEHLDAAINPIRHYAAGDPEVVHHLIVQLRGLAAVVPPEHRKPITRQTRLTVENARRKIELPDDLCSIEEAAAWTSAEQ